MFANSCTTREGGTSTRLHAHRMHATDPQINTRSICMALARVVWVFVWVFNEAHIGLTPSLHMAIHSAYSPLLRLCLAKKRSCRRCASALALKFL